MKVNRTSIFLFIGLLIGGSVGHAVDVDIPGASDKIEKEAYRNYRWTGKYSDSMHDKSVKMVEESVKRAPEKHNDIDKDVYITEELNHALLHSYSVYILKKHGLDLSFSHSSASMYGAFNINKANTIVAGQVEEQNGTIYYSAEYQPGGSKWEESNIEYKQLTAPLIKQEFESKYAKSKSMTYIDGDIFSYPTIQKGTWNLFRYKDKPIGRINFTMKNDPSIAYHIGFSLNSNILETHIKDDEKLLIDRTMETLANYVLPSIKPASVVLQYTEPVVIDDFTFRMLTGSKLVNVRTDENNVEYHVYQSGDIHELLVKAPVSNVGVKQQSVFYNYLLDFINKEQIKKQRGIQYATVWNDGLPGAYFEVHDSEKSVYIMTVYNDTYRYTYYVMKPNDVHISDYQIRDMVQYIEYPNLERQEQRISLGLGAPPELFNNDLSLPK